jgi:hypothetical protein
MTRFLWWLGLAILALQPVSTTAQTTQNRGVSIFFGTARREDNRTGEKISRSGIAVGLEGYYSFGRVMFDLRYLQSGLPGSPMDTTSHDLVEGELFVGTQVLPWLNVKLGRHIRSVIIGGVTELWRSWELRLRTQGEVYAPASQAYGVHTYGEIWLALAGWNNVTGEFGAGRGIEGGMYVRLRDSPITGRLGYRVDRSSVADGPRLENIQEMTISIGWGW